MFSSQSTLRTSDTETIKITPLRLLPRTSTDRMFQVAFRGIGKLFVKNFPTKHQLLLVLKTPEIVQRRKWCASWGHHDFIGMKKRTSGQKKHHESGAWKSPNHSVCCMSQHALANAEAIETLVLRVPRSSPKSVLVSLLTASLLHFLGPPRLVCSCCQ